MLAQSVALGALVTMFVIFVVYISLPIKIYGRDISKPRDTFNARIEYATQAKRIGLSKSYLESKKNTDFQDMIDNFKAGKTYGGPGSNAGSTAGPLYKEDPSVIYNAFAVGTGL